MQTSDPYMMSGWLLVDKPQGLTSATIVGKLRHHLQKKLPRRQKQQKTLKIGHGGTLDPFATGLLPIALGEATKTVAYIMHGQKRYRFQIHWGQKTDTLDVEGKVLATDQKRPKEADILAILSQFTGEIYQIPPAFSAIKVNGKRSYALARKGEITTLPSRTVYVHSLALIDTPDNDHANFDVTCSKGTYIRTLAQDIATALHCYGHVCTLQRLTVMPFDIASSISLDNALLLPACNWQTTKSFYPLEYVLHHAMPAIQLDASQALRLRNGLSVPIALALNNASPPDISVDKSSSHGYNSFFHSPDKDFTVWSRGQAIALARLEQGMIKSKRAFNHRKKPLFMKGTV